MQDADDPVTFEELRARQRRRFLIFGLPLVGLLLIGLGFAARPTIRAVKGWQARRLAREAFPLIERGQFQDAADKASDACVLSRGEPEVWRVIGRLCSRTVRHSEAMKYWRAVAQVQQLTAEDRRDYAASALATGALPEATTQINWLLAQSGPPLPADALLASQLASRQGSDIGAMQFAQQVLADNRSKPDQQMTALFVTLQLAPPTSPLAADAWKRIAKLARDPANPISLDALTLLAKQALPVRSPDDSSLLDASPVAVGGMSPAELAAALENHPQAQASHRLRALDIRARADPGQLDAIVEEAVRRFGGGDDETLAAWQAGSTRRSGLRPPWKWFRPNAPSSRWHSPCRASTPWRRSGVGPKSGVRCKGTARRSIRSPNACISPWPAPG